MNNLDISLELAKGEENDLSAEYMANLKKYLQNMDVVDCFRDFLKQKNKDPQMADELLVFFHILYRNKVEELLLNGLEL